MADNINLKEFKKYLLDSESIVIKTDYITRVFIYVLDNRVFYSKCWSDGQNIESIIDLEDALLLYNLHK